MSFGKSKSKSSSTQSQTNTLSPWSQQQFQTQTQGLMDAVGNYTSQPFKAYTGQMVAGMDPMQAQARQVAGQNVGAWEAGMNEAEAAARAGAGFNPADVSQFYNPYERDVVDAAGNYFDEQLARNLSQNQARATQSGAYGGSRHGIADAELMRTSAMDRAGMMADLRYRGHEQALDTGFRNAQNQYQGAQAMAGLSAQRQAQGMADVSMLEQLGADAREIEQAQLLAQRAEFDREAKDQLDKLMIDLQTRQGILSGTPMLVNSTGTGNSTGKTSSFSLAPSFSFGPFSFGGS